MLYDFREVIFDLTYAFSYKPERDLSALPRGIPQFFGTFWSCRKKGG